MDTHRVSFVTNPVIIIVVFLGTLEKKYLMKLVQSMPITTNIVRSNPTHGEVYSIQHYVIKFDSDLWKVGGCIYCIFFL
jgi:hypothetical protein